MVEQLSFSDKEEHAFSKEDKDDEEKSLDDIVFLRKEFSSER